MGRKDPCEIWPINDGYDEDEFPGDLDYYEVLDQVDNLFKHARIRVASYEEPYEACMTEKGVVLGATVAGQTGGTDYTPDGTPVYTVRFSVVVSAAGRRKGIARRLVKSLVKDWESQAQMMDSYFLLEAWVVNPHMLPLLESEGFEGDGEWSPDNPIMGQYLG